MKTNIYILLYLFALNSTAQEGFKIEGNFSNTKQKEIRLVGFVGTKDTLLSQTITDTVGNFSFLYNSKYSGAATIQVKESSSIIILLNKENVGISWSDIKEFNTVQFSKSKENEWFQKGYNLNVAAQKKLAGLNYLLPLYQKEETKKAWSVKLETEIQFQAASFTEYLKKLPNASYCKAYLNYRDILQQLQNKNKAKAEEIAKQDSFLAIDFGSINLYHSGLVKELFDEYLKQQLSLSNPEMVLKKINAFSDIMKQKTQNNAMILNEYSEYLLQQYEKNGIIAAAEHLALSLLDDTKCSIDSKRIPLLEQYKKMAIGNEAPSLALFNSKYKTLAAIPSQYKVVVFGASWCEACKNEIPQFNEYTAIFKTKYNTEIVFIALDTDKENYNNFTKDFAFISSCDYKGWESPNVKNYYVFATPTIFIIDDKNKIVAKPATAIQSAAWLYSNNK